jgi:hypothetical protein
MYNINIKTENILVKEIKGDLKKRKIFHVHG